MDEKPSNPFTQNRASLPTVNSLLTYGDNTVSFFNRINNNKLYQSQISFANQRQVQARILQKYQQQIYTMDSQGHCLAETLIDQMITEDGDKQQDFWEKIKALPPKKQIKNPFASNNKSTNRIQVASFSNKGIESKFTKAKQTAQIKMKRHSTREQIIKLKDIIKKEKQKQGKNKIEKQQFSLVNMYKIKRENDQLAKPITVTDIPPQKVQPLKIEEAKIDYPSRITFKDAIYYSIPL